MISKQSVLYSFGILSMLFATALRAQNGLEADAVAFRIDSTKGEVELYYGVLERALAFKQIGRTWNATLAARAEVWQNGKVVAAKDIYDTVRHTGTQKEVEALGANKLLGAAGFTVPYVPQTSAVFLWQHGLKNGKPLYDTMDVSIALPDHDASHIALGGIELGSSADKSNGSPSPFEKAGVIFMPNPSAVFGENYTKLYYYTEVYLPKALVDPSGKLEVVTSVIDPSGKEILSSTTKYEMLGETLPIVGAIDIDGLAEDSYKFRVRVKHDDAIVAEAQKTFYYTSEMKISEEAPAPASIDESALFAGSEFSKMTDAEADERVAQSLYVAGDADRKASKALKDVAAKQSFLFNFWRKQDQAMHEATPLTSYHLFLRRVDSANKMFTHMKTPGWKSSRGRVFLVYGSPNYLDEHRVETSAKPYIRWEYDPNPAIRLVAGAQRAEFVFLDRQGGGDFVLVHSNVIGETYQADWYSREALRLAH